MSKSVLIILAIIMGIGVGTGAIVFGVLILTLGSHADEVATIVAGGSAILAASISALLAKLAGGFRQLDHPDDPDF